MNLKIKIKMFIINIVPTAIMYNTLFYIKTTIKTIYTAI